MTDEWAKPCGYCDGMADYDGGMVRIDEKPICRGCLNEKIGDTHEQ